jgi:hypothetical protein
MRYSHLPSLVRFVPNPDEPEPKQGGNRKQETENGKPEMKNGPDRFPVFRFPFPVFCFSFSFPDCSRLSA